MYSLRLWHFLLTAGVVTSIVSLTVFHLFSDDSHWQRTSAKALQRKMDVGLEQIYWQWQNEGRPSEILYKPSHSEQAVAIKVTEDGRPDFDINPHSCRAFLNWFVDGVSVDEFVHVGARELTGGPQRKAPNACEFKMADTHFAYHANNY